MNDTVNKFESKEFQENFDKALAHYHSAIDSDENPPEAAQKFMDNIFDSDADAAYEYFNLLEAKEDSVSAQALKNIVINGNV